eukprot:12902094-Prorocentrum_lima.AAC.1
MSQVSDHKLKHAENEQEKQAVPNLPLAPESSLAVMVALGRTQHRRELNQFSFASSHRLLRIRKRA